MCVEKYVKMMRILFVGHMTDLSYDVDGPEAITGNSHIWDLPGHDPPITCNAVPLALLYKSSKS